MVKGSNPRILDTTVNTVAIAMSTNAANQETGSSLSAFSKILAQTWKLG
jgi:hypothetical protein